MRPGVWDEQNRRLRKIAGTRGCAGQPLPGYNGCIDARNRAPMSPVLRRWRRSVTARKRQS